MAEAIGVASSVAQLLEASIRVLGRIRKAYERHHSLIAVLDKHALEIESISVLVCTINDEDALQTAVVISELTRVHAIGTRLAKCLGELDPGNKGKVRQLAHQLVHGTRDEETLADILKDLDRAKANLGLLVQLANVGISRIIHDTMLANVEVIHRIDRLLSVVLGEGHGLKLAGLLKDRTSQADDRGLVALQKTDIALLDREMTRKLGTLGDKIIDRIIVGNTARDSAIQLLGPVGRDMWEDARVRIERNTASEHAAQFIYPTSFAAFKTVLDHQERLAALQKR